MKLTPEAEAFISNPNQYLPELRKGDKSYLVLTLTNEFNNKLKELIQQDQIIFNTGFKKAKKKVIEDILTQENVQLSKIITQGTLQDIIGNKRQLDREEEQKKKIKKSTDEEIELVREIADNEEKELDQQLQEQVEAESRNFITKDKIPSGSTNNISKLQNGIEKLNEEINEKKQKAKEQEEIAMKEYEKIFKRKVSLAKDKNKRTFSTTAMNAEEVYEHRRNKQKHDEEFKINEHFEEEQQKKLDNQLDDYWKDY